MTVKQLREFYTPEDLGKVYAQPYDHTMWDDHVERVSYTATVLDRFASSVGAYSVADLSCGDASIISKSEHRWGRRVLGDIHWRPGFHVTGPIEQTVQILPAVDMFVCSETLEHVEDPLGLLRAIRRVTDHLLLTTPHGEWDDGNPQHYWGWDSDGISGLLAAANFNDVSCHLFTPKSIAYYTFQIWQCS